MIQIRGGPVDLSNCTMRPDVRIDAEMSSNCTDYDYLTGELENVTMSYLYSPGEYVLNHSFICKIAQIYMRDTFCMVTICFR